jgi:hypothetical protein
MRARALVDGASFGSEALKAIGQAFDEAWTEIAGHSQVIPSQKRKRDYPLLEAITVY